jgi:hypothetical protein
MKKNILAISLSLSLLASQNPAFAKGSEGSKGGDSASFMKKEMAAALATACDLNGDKLPNEGPFEKSLTFYCNGDHVRAFGAFALFRSRMSKHDCKFAVKDSDLVAITDPSVDKILAELTCLSNKAPSGDDPASFMKTNLVAALAITCDLNGDKLQGEGDFEKSLTSYCKGDSARASRAFELFRSFMSNHDCKLAFKDNDPAAITSNPADKILAGLTCLSSNAPKASSKPRNAIPAVKEEKAAEEPNFGLAQ